MQLGQPSLPTSVNCLCSGLGPAMAYNVALNSTRFSLFRALEDQGLGPMAGGFAAGGVAGFLSSPLARWRTLRQAGLHSSILPASAMLANPFAGATAWALRNAGHTACIFSFFEAARTRLARSDSPLHGKPGVMIHLAASLAAASASCLLMNPLDVYATRVFHASGGGGSGSLRAAPPGPSLQAAVSAGYHGLSANLLRTVPHTVLTFVFIEQLRQRLPAALDIEMPKRRASLPQSFYVEAKERQQ